MMVTFMMMILMIIVMFKMMFMFMILVMFMKNLGEALNTVVVKFQHCQTIKKNDDDNDANIGYGDDGDDHRDDDIDDDDHDDCGYFDTSTPVRAKVLLRLVLQLVAGLVNQRSYWFCVI